MFRTNRICIVLLVAALGPLGGASALAQQPEYQMINFTGKVAGIKPGAIAVISKEGQQYVVAVDQTSKITVTGTAKAEFLRPGVPLRFVAELDKKGNATTELTELKIYIPEERSPPGIVRNDPAATEGPFQITGIVRSLKKGKLTVGAGSKSVRGDLKDDATIELATTDYSLAKEGDEITVRGRLVQAGQTVDGNVMPGAALGDEIEIKLAEPASAPSKKKGRAKKS